MLFDDRWASVREDFARAWHGDEAARNRNFTKLDAAATQQAKWWLNQARSKQRSGLVSFYGRVLSDQTEPTFADDTAIITGAAPGSIAGAVAAALLEGGATVVATTSSLDGAKTDYFRQLYRDHASGGAKLWVLPANLASFSDIDDLVSWIGAPVVATAAGQQTEIRPALAPTLVFPFAAPGVSGTAADAGSRAEVEFRVLVWGVERLITGLAAIGADHRLGQRVHVVLPGSPNRGRFGGDGAYGEAKAAFDALVQKWHVESDWARRISFAHALIGWVRGTGLMGRNDPLVDAVTAAGVSTWSPEEMAAELLALCAPQQRIEAAHAPLLADLTGGLDQADLNLGELAREFASTGASSTQAEPAEEDEDQLLALTHPAGWQLNQPTQPWAEVSQPLEEMVCIVAAGEVGPVGSSRTRLQLEVEDGLSAAGIIELAWTTGRIVYETEPTPTWTDAKSGESLTEAEIIDRFGQEIEAGLGIRRFHDEGSLIDGTAPLMVPVYCEEDTSFLVRSQDEAQAFVTEDPERTKVEAVEDGFMVTRLKGSLIRVPRRFKLTRFVGAQVPEGFDPKVWGLGAMTESIDRLAAWNLVATIDAFISSGVTPAELLRWVHPTQMANTQGTGIGGMKATRSMYVDALLGETPQADILQEALPNVIAAHTAQSFLGGYGSMVHPVAACATAAVSVEEGF
ncbi:MAG TPA: beta-ketoacyl synthase N-terminal-like domain-containing protein, partial [Marmoricola sp.]|nr:beta-ketoacyl synthase N-terminal-like domain-containing protein [Marmoricola sp.]